MNLGQYQLLAQLDSGSDGVAYRAIGPPERTVEVRDLSRARTDSTRWTDLCKRLRIAAMVRHPAPLDIYDLDLAHEPPFLALEWVDANTLGQQRKVGPFQASAALALIRDVAGALAIAHRLGLPHGRLSPTSIRVAAELRPKIDFTGIEVSTPIETPQPLEMSCRAPELAGQDAISQPDCPADVFALGGLLFWLLTGSPPPSISGDNALLGKERLSVTGHQSLDSAIERLILQCLAPEPSDRPAARDVEERLAGILNLGRQSAEQTQGIEAWRPEPSLPAPVRDGVAREQLGRFRLLEKLGQGGMGVVYRAQDPTDGSIVAVKILRPHLLEDVHAVRRFEKEARLLAKVNNPFVVNLLEVNKDDGIHFLVMEYATGKNLAALLEEKGKLDEPTALAIMADVARALLDAHERGIVHRDIKPGNIILENKAGQNGDSSFQGKLLDFGLARHMVESESLQVTQAGVPVGTPLYMAPEQGLGKAIDPRADVYAMGATLFHLLAGRPPFEGLDPLLGPISLILRHAKEPLPSLKKLVPGLSDGVCQIVEKALAKAPEARYADAGAMLQDLQRLLRGEPTSIAVHPRMPAGDPRRVFQFDWVWDLQASPAQLWPYVSNTERLNRAAGIPAVAYSTQSSAAGVRLFGQFRKAGFNNVWEEHPFEWIEGRRMGVLREYSEGVFLWLMTATELEPLPDGGTRLTHRVRIEPRNLVGRLVARVEVGIRGRKAVERVYQRIDALLTGKLGNPALVDAFEPPPALRQAQRQRLERLLGELRSRGTAPFVAEKLGEFLANAPPQEVARIRPLALAAHLGIDPDEVVAACLHAAQVGLLVLMWDLLCPVCRIPSQVKDSMKALRDHGHCEARNLDFPLDFAKSVEMIFRAAPEIRASDLATYCLGGPDHSPHVVAQVRVAAGETMELPLDLPGGSYRIRGPQLPFAVEFRVHGAATSRRLELTLAGQPSPALMRSLRTGGQTISFTNDGDQELVVRVERTAGRGDALTAARASSLALFRELFPAEVLTPGQLVSVATVTLLVTDLADADRLYRELGETRAFGLIHEHFRILEERIRQNGGAPIKTVEERLFAAFDDPVAAVRTALDLARLLAEREPTRTLRLRTAVHRGPAMMATFNDQLDYFGNTVKLAARLPGLAGDGEVILSQEVATHPQVAAWLRGRGLGAELFSAEWSGSSTGVLHRLSNL